MDYLEIIDEGIGMIFIGVFFDFEGDEVYWVVLNIGDLCVYLLCDDWFV